MERTWIVFAVTVAYIVVTTVVGMWSVKHAKDTTSFMTAKNHVGPYLVGLLVMSEFIGPVSTIGTAQGAYEQGLSVAWNTSSLVFGFLLYGFFIAPRMHRMGEYTISGALALHYGNAIRVIVSLTMAMALIAVNVAAFTGGAAAIGALLHVSTQTAVWIVAIVANLNVAFGGIRGVGVANLIHVVAKYAGLLLVAGTAWSIASARPEVLAAIPASYFSLVEGAGLSAVTAWTIGSIGAVFSTQYVLQSVCGLQTPADAKKAAIIGAVAVFPIGFISSYIGIVAKGVFPNIKSILALPAFFDLMNPWLVGVVASALVAATFVVILACQLGTTALVMKDFYIPLVKPQGRHEIWATRLASAVIGLVPVPLALLLPGLIKTIFFGRALRTSVTILLLFMLFLPHMASKTGGLVALILSFAATIAWFLMGNPWGVDNMYVALFVPLVVLLGDHAVRRLVRPAGEPAIVP